ncbi:hypothetical protein AMK50_05625 [Salmonella enterica subsp. enterica serovar Enteritidis]|nr:hypothetical protein [Salmonella enterica subsp. enterica serovar Enteritidis]
MKRFKEMAVILFFALLAEVLRRRRWRMILFHMFWIMFLIKSLPVTLFLLEWGNQDIWGLGLGLGVINMMEFY